MALISSAEGMRASLLPRYTVLCTEFADGQALIKDGRIVEKGNYVVLVFANTDGASYTDIDKALSAALD